MTALTTTARARINVTGGRGPRGFASGPLGAGSVTAETISDDTDEQIAITDKIRTTSGDTVQEVLDDHTADLDDHEGRVVALETTASIFNASFLSPSWRRAVPAAFINGDGLTRRDLFPVSVNGRGLGSVVMSRTPLEVARGLPNVIAHEDDPDVWVSPAGGGDESGDSRANAMPWADAWRTLTTARKLLLVGNKGPYPALSLVLGTHAGAAVPKWLYAVDGYVEMRADTYNGPATSLSWSLHSGSVYKATLSGSGDGYDLPTAILDRFRADPGDGRAASLFNYAAPDPSTPYLATALANLVGGGSGPGFVYDRQGAIGTARTLYASLDGPDLTVSDNQAALDIIYANKVLDHQGIPEFSAEWYMVGTTVILEGTFYCKGVWPNSVEGGGSSPIFLAQAPFADPSYTLGSAVYGIRAEGFCYTSNWQVDRSKYDGLNGYKGSQTGATSFIVGHNFASRGSGDLGTWGTIVAGNPRATNLQGWSVHGGVNAILAGAVLQDSYGQSLADICDPTHNSASWLIGVDVREAALASGVRNGIYIDSSAGAGTGSRAAWVDSCGSTENTRDLVAVGSAVKVHNSALPSRLTTGVGSITAYTPEAP